MQARFKERDEDVKIHTPRNLETLQLSFRGERVAKAIGALADKTPQPNDVLSGLLVAKDYSYTLLNPRDLRDFAGLSTCTVTQRQKISLNVGWELVRWHLEGMYGGVEEGMDRDGIRTMRVMGILDVKHSQEHELTLEWESSASNDMIADSTLSLVTGIDKSPASVKLTTRPHVHSHDEKKEHPHGDQDGGAATTRQLRGLALFFEAHFGEVELHMPETSNEEPELGEDDNEPSLLVTVDDSIACINLVSMTITSTNETLRKRVEAVLDMAVTTVTSLSSAFTSGVSLSGEEVGNDKRLVEDQSMEHHEGMGSSQQDEAQQDKQQVSEQPAPSNEPEKMVIS